MRTDRNIDALKEYLASLDCGVKPSVHVNDDRRVPLVVDFGTPLTPVKLTQEQEDTIYEKMYAYVGRNYKAQHDPNNGIYWMMLNS